MSKTSKDAKYGFAITAKMRPDDRARIERIAEREQRPLSSMLRILALSGAAQYERALEQQRVTDPALPTTAA